MISRSQHFVLIEMGVAKTSIFRPERKSPESWFTSSRINTRQLRGRFIIHEIELH